MNDHIVSGIRPLHLQRFARLPMWLLATGALVVTTLFTVVSIALHQTFQTAAYDLGLFDQAFWRYSQLLPNFNTVRGMNILGDHFSLVALVFGPLYRLWPDVTWAFLLQSLSVAAGGCLLFAISRHLLPGRSWVALGFAFAYWLHPAVHNTLLWQYHEIVLASGLYLALIWAYLKERPALYLVTLLLLLSCREDMPFTLAAFGVVALIERRWRWGLATIAIAVAWWVIVTRVAMPWFNQVGYFRASQGALAVLFSNLTNPSFYLERLLDPRAQAYLVKVLLPAGVLGLLAPRYLLPAAPTLAANVLINGYNTDLKYHYSVNAMPFLFLAAVAGTARALDLLAARPRLTERLPALATITTLAVCAALAARYTVLEPRNFGQLYADWREKAGKREHIAQLNRLTGSDGVAATDWLLPHFSQREHIYLFPNPWRLHYWGVNGESQHHPNAVKYVILNRQDTYERQELYDYLIDSGAFTQISDAHDLIVLKRIKLEASDRNVAIENIRRFSPLPPPPFTRTWISPPYPTPESEFRRLDLDPGAKQAPLGGTDIPDLPSGAVLDLDLTLSQPSDNTTRYVRTEIVSPGRCHAQLALGSDDGVTLWLNGRITHEHIVLRGARLGDDNVDLSLRRGRNVLFFRVNNAGGGFRLLALVKLKSCAK